jgi:hypothetical protein
MKECMKDKVDADRKANREKNGLGKQWKLNYYALSQHTAS